MIIKYKFVDGTSSEVEVDDEIGEYLSEADRLEKNYNRKERYHCLSLDRMRSEGREYADVKDPSSIFVASDESERLNIILQKLSETQRRRFLLHMDGMTDREIANVEGVNRYAVQKSVKLAQKKLKKFFEKGVQNGF